MKAFRILELKDFTSKLFIGSYFDSFYLVSAQFVTAASFSLDGRLVTDFLSDEEKAVLEEKPRSFVFWGEEKELCRSVIRGKRLPVSFQIVLRSPKSFDAQEDLSAFLNIQFKNRQILCTSGISRSGFSLDKSTDALWDEEITAFFKRAQIACEIL